MINGKRQDIKNRQGANGTLFKDPNSAKCGPGKFQRPARGPSFFWYDTDF